MRHAIVAVISFSACATSGSANPTSSGISTQATEEMARGDYAAALATADHGLVKHRSDAWLLYERGAALADLGRTDEAVRALDAAERHFGDAHDRSLAVYRRALALERAGDCAAAATQLARYADLIRPENPGLAADALTHVSSCVAPTPQQLAEREESAHQKETMNDATLHEALASSTEAGRALVRGDYATALARANDGLEVAPEHPWLLYDRGAALAGLGRTDEALAPLRDAEQRFAAADVHGRAVATYRRALALEVDGRCQEEQAELEHYAALTGTPPAQLARLEKRHINACRLAHAGRTTF